MQTYRLTVEPDGRVTVPNARPGQTVTVQVEPVPEFEPLTLATAKTPEEREAIYFEFQQLWHDTVPTVVTFQATSSRYEQRWLNGYYFRVGQFGTDYRTLSLTGQ